MKIDVFPLLVLPLALSGCVAGTVVSGEHRLLSEPYPDIRTVPSREEAEEPRASHEEDEVQEREQDFRELEVERALQEERNQDLRSSHVDIPPLPEIPPLELDELNEITP